MADPNAPAPPSPPTPPRRIMPSLLKQRSWSPETDRDEKWLRRKGIHKDRRRRGMLSRSVTDEDFDELRACIDLGFFGTDSPCDGECCSTRLMEAFPALELYYAVNRQYSESLSGDSLSSAGSSPMSIYSPGESPQQVKAKLKQWAQVVACTVRRLH